jgi:protein-disulfide isomerase
VGKARRTRRNRELERRQARTRRALIAAGAAVLLVVALIVIQQVTKGDSNRPDPSKLTGLADVQAEFDGLPEKAGTIGKASAKVTITEYGDLRCPICKQFDNEVLPTVVENLVRNGKAKLRFRLWPILGPNSVAAAQWGYAAQQQNALWRYAALTYLNQGNENDAWFTPSFARAVAEALGLDLDRFDKDRASAAANQAIQQVDQEARGFGFPGTPAVRVSGPGGSQTVDFGSDAYAAIAAAVQKASGSAG